MRYFVLIFVAFICSCSNSVTNQYIPSGEEVIVDEILKKMEKELSQEYCMDVISDTAGLANSVNVLGLGFEIYGPLTQDQLRIILIGCVKKFLAEVNSNKEIRPYLKVYPFTSREIEITLFVRSKGGANVYAPDIGVASARHGELIYKTTDKNDPLKYKSIVKESYEDAAAISLQ